MKNPIKSPKIRQTCGQLKTSDFVKNIQKNSRKQVKIACFRLIFGRSDRIRTCGIDVPNAKMPIFSLLYKAFRGFCVQNQCFRVLLEALFPRSPNLQMVKTVVKPVSMGYGCYQEIENPTPHKFFFCHYYTILRRNSQQAFRRYKI